MYSGVSIHLCAQISVQPLYGYLGSSTCIWREEGVYKCFGSCWNGVVAEEIGMGVFAVS